MGWSVHKAKGSLYIRVCACCTCLFNISGSQYAIPTESLSTMTPAINQLKKQKITHTLLSYEHDSNSGAYGIEAATKLNLPPEQVFKTLVVENDKKQLLVAIIPVHTQLSMKLIAKAAGAKKAAMAAPEAVMKSTGYVLGGVSPFGQKRKLPTFIDASATALEHIYVSAGKRGLDVKVALDDAVKLLDASLVALSQSSE